MSKNTRNLPVVLGKGMRKGILGWLDKDKRAVANNGLFIVSDGNRTYAEYFDAYDSMKYFGEPTMSGFRVDRCVVAWTSLPEPYVPDTNIGKMSEIQTDCSNLDSCENCKYDDGECCRLLYEAKMESEDK